MKNGCRKSISEILSERQFHNEPVSYSTHRTHDDEYDRLLFRQWEAADNIVKRLEEIRDANMPTSPDENWNDEFCNAISLLPEARRFAEECWYEYYSYKGN